MKLAKALLLIGVGFLLYPGVFVPVMCQFFPGAMNAWIHIYAEYLRMLGV